VQNGASAATALLKDLLTSVVLHLSLAVLLLLPLRLSLRGLWKSATHTGKAASTPGASFAKATLSSVINPQKKGLLLLLQRRRAHDWKKTTRTSAPGERGPLPPRPAAA